MQVIVSDVSPGGWDDLVMNCLWGSFYHSTDNLKLITALASEKINFIYCYDNGQLIGGIAYVIKNGFLGNVINCLPYFGSYGDALIAPSAPRETEELIYHRLIEECKAMDALCVNIITSPFAKDGHHKKVNQILDPTFVEKRLCQISTLPEYSINDDKIYREKIIARLHGNARTAYKKAIKGEFKISVCVNEAEALEFARAHKLSIEAKCGIYKTEKFFLKILEMSKIEPQKTEIVILKDKDKLIAGTVLFYFKDTVEYHSVFLHDDYRSSNALHQIIVEKMIDAGMNDYRFWNFGGTWKTQEGLYKFKRSFGANDYPYFYYTTFFRDVERIKNMTKAEILKAYPYFYVIPFSELAA